VRAASQIMTPIISVPATTTWLRRTDVDSIIGVAPSQQTASRAFYSALPVLDDGSAMEKVWANTPYVTYVGPMSDSIIVGWDAQKNIGKSSTDPFP
jgi:hypothetical protein